MFLLYFFTFMLKLYGRLISVVRNWLWSGRSFLSVPGEIKKWFLLLQGLANHTRELSHEKSSVSLVHLGKSLPHMQLGLYWEVNMGTWSLHPPTPCWEGQGGCQQIAVHWRWDLVVPTIPRLFLKNNEQDELGWLAHSPAGEEQTCVALMDGFQCQLQKDQPTYSEHPG